MPMPTAIDPSMVANLVKFELHSDKWAPNNTAQLGFDAFVQKCSDPTRVKVGCTALAELSPSNWFIDALDELVFVSALEQHTCVTLGGYAKFASPEGPPTFKEIVVFGQREGIEFTELEIYNRRRNTHAVDR